MRIGIFRQVMHENNKKCKKPQSIERVKMFHLEPESGIHDDVAKKYVTQ